ncbi:hypothetical protein DERP_000591 [Dermatophagoides pteronyssinus]|uniref:Uncharacterized protein n=1 Tax=Dermatophagoides pteronyssinus TaxID=6956 RepID=A0ABQ8J0L0_DERPT|nr:hypothetical protein DERP_000591 [Dermatophagoides pteronyssinus]
MKPKERFISYALLSSSTSSSTNHQCVVESTNSNSSFSIKEDIPIDLSVKKSSTQQQQSIVVVQPPLSIHHHSNHNFGLFKEYDHQQRQRFFNSNQSQSSINDWSQTNVTAAAAIAAAANNNTSGRYSFPNLMKHHYHPPPPQPSSTFHSNSHPTSGNIFPYLFIDPVGCGQLPLPSSLPPLPPPPLPQQQQPSSTNVSHSNNIDHNHHQLKSKSTLLDHYIINFRLKKSSSYPCLPSLSSSLSTTKRRNFCSRSKSESNLLRSSSSSSSIKPILFVNNNHRKSTTTKSIEATITTTTTTTNNNSPTKICAPKKLFASNYLLDKSTTANNNYKESKNSNEKFDNNKQQKQDSNQTKFYRNYRKEVIECWDNERRDNEQIKQRKHSLNNNHNHNGYDDDSGSDHKGNNGTHSMVKSSSFENNGLYETKRTSPDCSQDGLIIINGGSNGGGITELRSADTTNGTIFDRKRISRPLTGKHVRHGTGASPTTLLTLKNMIQQRQKLKEINQFNNNFGNNNIRYGKSSSTKTNKRIKRK